jgi:small subunit ribosomal protein S8
MDPISNMLIMIKNASLANKDKVVFPYSKLKLAIGECLAKEGYVKSVSKKVKKDQAVIEVELVYTDKKPKISEVERISKQSRRVYFGMDDIHVVKGGTGLLVLSTPKGILSEKSRSEERRCLKFGNTHLCHESANKKFQYPQTLRSPRTELLLL